MLSKAVLSHGIKAEELPIAHLAPVQSIAIWGPSGSGKTTMAVNIADELARQRRRVLLVDADMVVPSGAILLGLGNDATGIASICRLAREAKLDTDQLLRVALRIDAPGGGFHFIPGISSTLRWAEVTPSAIEVLLRVASLAFDVVIFDLSSSIEPALRTEASALTRHELTRYLLTNSERALLVCAADPIGIHRFVRQFLEVQKLRASLPFVVAVNRLREASIGRNPSKQIEQVFEQLLKVRPHCFLPDDSDRVDEALRQGIPVRLISRRSPLAKAVAELASSLVE